jgi:hypothetical protein
MECVPLFQYSFSQREADGKTRDTVSGASTMAPAERLKLYAVSQGKVDRIRRIGKLNHPCTKSTKRARVLPTLFIRVLPKPLKSRLSGAIFSQNIQKCERGIARNV